MPWLNLCAMAFFLLAISIDGSNTHVQVWHALISALWGFHVRRVTLHWIKVLLSLCTFVPLETSLHQVSKQKFVFLGGYLYLKSKGSSAYTHILFASLRTCLVTYGFWQNRPKLSLRSQHFFYGGNNREKKTICIRNHTWNKIFLIFPS
jgi:hypothetical protein